MEIICKSCSAKLTIADSALPKGVAVVNGKCPKCQQLIEIRIPRPAQEPAAAKPPEAVAPASAPAKPPESPAAQAPAPAETVSDAARAAEAPSPEAAAASPAELPAVSPAEEEFAEGRRLALACFDQPEARADVKAALESAGYSVHAPARAEDAIHWLARHKYEVVILHEEYGGSVDKNLLLQAIQPMAIAQRRHMCVGLVGKGLRTFDNMAAFAKSVNFVVSERELGKIKAIARQAAVENDQFYSVFREALREAGKT